MKMVNFSVNWGVSNQKILRIKKLTNSQLDTAAEVYCWATLGRSPTKEEVDECLVSIGLNTKRIDNLLSGKMVVKVRYDGISQLIGERGDIWLLQRQKFSHRQSDARLRQTLASALGFEDIKSNRSELWPPRLAALYMGGVIYNNYVATRPEVKEAHTVELFHEDKSFCGLIGALMILKYDLILVAGLVPWAEPVSKAKENQVARQLESVRQVAYGEGGYFPEEWANKTRARWQKIVKDLNFKSCKVDPSKTTAKTRKRKKKSA